VILLDTHVVIWLALTPERISSAASEAIRIAESTGEIPRISAISLYEIANAIRRGRIQPIIPSRVLLDRLQSRFKVFPVSDSIAICAAELGEPFHGDPLDRMIAATAIVENCTLITADARVRASGACKALW
jgi:PIN domain nuclease of toxin-antitoxin system